MKKTGVLLLLLLFTPLSPAQEYKITTTQKDDFSKALVQLLNCAANRFKDCTGDSLRSTWLLGDDYRLTIPFPGSTIGVVRTRDYDRNVYVEFRGYKNVEELNKGLKSLIERIQKALGDQLVPPVITGNQKTITQFSMLAIRDQHGYFTQNIELLPGSSHADPYLLGSEREEESNRPKKYFILLKVKGGVPSYQYYIKDGVSSPDQKLHAILKMLMKEAVTDFDSLPVMRLTERKHKKVDTLQIDGYTIWLDRRGSHRSANIVFDIAEDSVAVSDKMKWCQQAIEAVVGSRYVYYPYSYSKTKSVIFYSTVYNPKNPRIELVYSPGQYREPVPVIIKIESIHSRPVKRSASLDD